MTTYLVTGSPGRRFGRVLIPLALILGAAGVAIIVMITPSAPKTRVQQEQPSDTVPRRLAYVMARDFVKPHLKAPSTAKWPGFTESVRHTQPLGNDRYRVSSWVDSQNSFGAMLRMRYVAVVFNTDGEQKNWTLESLDFP